MTLSDRTAGASREALRLAVIAGSTDCVLTPTEAAAFMGISESALRASDVPRADVAGTKYLKSQCIAYVRVRLSSRIITENAG